MEIGTGFLIGGPAGAAAGTIVYLTRTPFVPASDLLKTLKPGDLIEFNRVEFSHYAMYSDQPGYVINVPAEGKDKTTVKISLEKFLDVAKNGNVRVNNHDAVAEKLGYKKRSAREAVSAAKSKIGHTLPYYFLGRNCEFYCTEWLYGHGFTTQVSNAEGGYLGTAPVSQVHGVIGAGIGFAVGGPVGAAIGYTLSTAVVGGAMTAILTLTGTTHLNRE